MSQHDRLTASLSYMDSGEWLLEYDNIMYGIFAVRFDDRDGKVLSIKTLASDQVETGPYSFLKQ